MNRTRALATAGLAVTGLLAVTDHPATAQSTEDKPAFDPWFDLEGDPAGVYLVDPASGGITDIGLTLDMVEDYVHHAPLPFFAM